MRIDLYSTRAKLAEQGGTADVYQYDKIPKPVRVQLAQIFVGALGPSQDTEGTWLRAPRYNESHPIWTQLHKILCREFGQHTLMRNRDPMDDILSFFEHDASTLQCLDIIELHCKMINGWAEGLSDHERERLGISEKADEAIAELNHRLRRGAIGFQFESGEIIRVDSQLLHASAVKPVLQLLIAPAYKTVDEEFRKAHQHYRNQELEACLVECLKSLESMLIVICDEKGWAVPPKATASTLLDIVFKRGLVPAAISGQLTALRATLEQGVPALRNQMAGHGQGTATRQVPSAIAAYALHLTASSILLLAGLAAV